MQIFPPFLIPLLFSIIFSISHYAQIPVGGNILGQLPNDDFGEDVAMSGDGSRLVAGATFNSGPDMYAGHVRVFEYNNGNWIQLGEKINGDGDFDQTGWSVCMAENGNRIAFGAPWNDSAHEDAGLIRVYEYENGAWIQLGNDLTGSGAGDLAGYSVSLSPDGQRIAFGAIRFNAENGDAGYVAVFEYDGTNWIQLGNAIESSLTSDWFGRATSLSEDGNRIVIGNPFGGLNPANEGSVQVYEYNGNDWAQLGETLYGGGQEALLGHSVAISADGNRIAAGAPYADGSEGTNSGYARVFEYNNGNWEPLGDELQGQFVGQLAGWSVSLSGTGNQLLVSGIDDNNMTNDLKGRVNLYVFDGNDWLKSGATVTGSTSDLTGFSVDFSGDGQYFAVSSPYYNDVGRVRVFESTPVATEHDYFVTKPVLIFPNPTKDKITFQNLWQGEKTIIVRDISGNIIESYRIDNYEINLSSLSAGFYLISIENKNRKVFKKVVKH